MIFPIDCRGCPRSGRQHLKDDEILEAENGLENRQPFQLLGETWDPLGSWLTERQWDEQGVSFITSKTQVVFWFHETILSFGDWIPRDR